MATLEAELVLNMSEALGQVDELASAIGDATEDVSVNVDVNLDDGAFDGLFDELDSLSEIPVEVEAELGDIDGLFDELDALSVPPVEVEVEATGVEEAEAEVEGLGSAAEGATSNMDGLGSSTAAFGAAAGASAGSAEGLIGVVGGLGPAGAAAAGGIAAVAASSTALFSAAVQSVGSTQRFATVLGEFAAQVDSVELGGLNLSLEEFATMIGQDDEALRNSLTTIAAAGEAYGVAGEDAAQYAEQLTLLAGRAVVLKPSLEISSTIDALNRSLATGGGRLARLGIDIGTVAERQQIANEIFGQSFEDLSRYEQSVVGAEAATRLLGSSLQRDIIEGSDNVEVKLKSLQQQFQNAFETIGEPLILPVFDLIEAGIPAALGLAEAFAALGRVLIPIATGYLEAVGPGLEIIAGAFDELATSLEGVDLEPLFEAFGGFVVAEAETFAAAIELLAAALPLVNFDTMILGLELLTTLLENSLLTQLADVIGRDLPKATGEATSGLTTLTEAEQEAEAATAAFVSAAVGALPKLGDVIGNVTQAGEAFGVLNAASDPANIQANIDAMTTSIVGFTSTLSLLANSGEDLDATLQFFAEQGLEGAPALAALADATEEERARFETSLEGYDTAITDFEAVITEGFGGAGTAGLGEFQRSVQEGVGAVGATANAAGTSAAEGLGSGFALAGLLVQGQMSIATALLVASGVLFTSTARQVGVSSGGALGVGFATSVGPGIQVGMSFARVAIATQGLSVAISAAGQGRSIGRALGQGIANGIEQTVATISRAAADAVNAAEQSAREAADTGSPSKVFMAVGRDMGTGMALGFAEGAGQMLAEAERITFAAAAGATVGGGGSNTNVGGVSVPITIYGDATPEAARMVRDAGADVASAVQKTLFDVGAA